MANSPCNGGTSTFSIDTDGVIYPCVVTVGIPEFVVGTIKEGVNKEKVTEILGWDKIEITECIGCSRYNYCNTTRCRILNLESAGLILEKNATRNDWTENDIVAFTDTYVIGHQQVCDQSVLVAVHQILSDIMGWGDNIVVDLNTNLFKNGLIHTNKIKQLIIDLEKQFGITINHSNIKYTSLCSINSIGKLIGGIVDEKTKIDS